MTVSRDELAEAYLGQLPYAPYPVQEEALLAWFTAKQGVLVCAPTGTGKTLIAQAALFEALHTGTIAYYTTPLIALTEQKFQEMQACAERWGFSAKDVGLVTGNRRVNPEARILIVVAEILLNRLLHPEGFDFSRVSAVVMDEFHNFADPERGIVWELTLSLLPSHVRLLLLSATVGNAAEFVSWLEHRHARQLELVESRQRRVPLTYRYVPDRFLGELLQEMAKGDPQTRKTPALIFCFNREECWSVAESLKGLDLIDGATRHRLQREIDALEWKQGIGPKLKQLLRRGLGVHHAGLLPKYRREIERLFEAKLLAAVICTETLAAGINLPARSVVLTALAKGPLGNQKILDPSTVHQICGRAGRPQYDKEGFVFALAHEDDVKIFRWKEKYDQIPEDTKDPLLLRAKKELKRKKPTRRDKVLYWSEAQFDKLKNAPPGRLYSKGPIPWRLLAYLLKLSPQVDRVRAVLRKRLMDEPRLRAGERIMEQMLLALAHGGYIVLEPAPPEHFWKAPRADGHKADEAGEYHPVLAAPTPSLDRLLVFRSVHPLYGAFLVEQLGIADRQERIQALESVLDMPRSLLRFVRVPGKEELPPGPLARTRLDPELIRRGLIAAPLPERTEDDADDLGDDEEDAEPAPWQERPATLADKLRLYFESLNPLVRDLRVQSIWCAGELLRYGGDFDKYVSTHNLVKQEGIVFRHLLRLILLLGEFQRLEPSDTSAGDWKQDLADVAERLTASCRAVDPSSTDEVIEQARAADVVEGEAQACLESA
jgi:superfamily II DNA/RNA helicase